MSKRAKTITVLILSIVAIALFTGVVSATTYTLSGRVTDQSGTPLEGVVIEVLVPGTGAVVVSDITDATGYYALTVEEGTYDIRVIPPSGSGFGSFLKLDQSIDANTELDFVLVTSGATLISGHLLDSEENPIVGQRVKLTSGSIDISDVTDASGAYEIEVAPGNYQVHVNPYQIASNAPRYFDFYTDYPVSFPQNTEFDIVLPSKKVTVLVQDPAGNPIEGVALSTTNAFDHNLYMGSIPAFGWSYYPAGISFPPTTDASGIATLWLFPNDPNETYTLTATPPDNSPFVATSLSNAHVNSDMNVTLTLETPITVSGHLLDSEENPIMGQRVKLTSGSIDISDITDASGAYEIEVAPGNYQVHVNPYQIASNAPRYFDFYTDYPVSFPQNTEFDIVLPSKKVTVLVQDPAGNPIEGVALSTTNAFDHNLYMGSIPAFGWSYYPAGISFPPTTDASGIATLWLFPNDPNETYTLTATPPDNSPFVATSLSNAHVNSDMNVTLTLETPITVSGHLLDSEENPIMGQRVKLTSGSIDISDITDASGAYEIEVAPGNYQVHVNPYQIASNAPRYFDFYTDYPVSFPQNTEFDIVLPSKKVTVLVQDPAGNPIEGVALSTTNAFDHNLYMGSIPAFGWSYYPAGISFPPTTDASGIATLWLFPNDPNETYTLTATPPDNSPFVIFSITNVEIHVKKTIVISLQFVHAPPATVASLSPIPDAQGRYPDPVTVSLSATAADGYTVDATYYSVDGGPDEEYAGPFEVAGDGLHTIRYWSVDNLGVYETPKTLNFEIFGLRIVTESPLPDGTIGVPYSVTLEAEGGTAPYTWSVAAGALPPGLALDADTGEISGIPTTAGTFGFTIMVTDSSLTTVIKQFALAPPPSSGTAGSGYTQPITVPDTEPGDTGGTPTCTDYDIIAGQLPDGVTIDPETGVISGTPLDGGTYNITVQCLVEVGQTAVKDFTITINNPFPTLTSLDPESKRAESNGFTLTLTGTNFVQSSMAYWNGSSRQTTYVSDTQLQALISADDIAVEGTAEVTVVNPEPIGGTSSALDFTILPANLPPTVNAGGSYSGLEGTGIALQPEVNDPDGDPLTHLWESSSTKCSFSDATIAAPTLTCYDNGSYTVTLTVSDGVHPSVSSEATVNVTNVAPTIALSGLADVDEGSVYTLTLGAVTDPGDDTVTEYIINWGDGETVTDTSGGDFTHTYADGPSSPIITVDLVDGDGTHLNAGSLAVTVNNVAPTITSLTTPDGPVDINEQPVSLEVAFSDPGILDTHDVSWDWGDGIIEVDSSATSPADHDHTYAEAGTYTIEVTVTDKDDGSDSETFEYVVIYDPEGGFVTGGGWILSPEGAYTPDPTLTGKANFGFVSKYKKGADTPTGSTEFQFKAGDLNFHSSSYDWLVVAGAKAKFKGVGTINGSGNYGFMLSAVDAAETSSTDTDLFRIKIWDKDNGDVIVYDNQFGADEDVDPATGIGGGNIIVHKAK